MNLKAKKHLENQKTEITGRLAARRAVLNERGIAAAAIQRDSIIRKLKAAIRKADYRLGCIAAQEKLNKDKLEARQKKLAPPQSAPAKPAKAAKGAGVKKEKKEKKKAPAAAEEQA